MSEISKTSADVLAKIKLAAESQTLLQITYVDAKGKPSIRTIEPYELKDDKLFAHCTVKNSIRAFNLNRIQSAELHLNEYSPRYPILI